MLAKTLTFLTLVAAAVSSETTEKDSSKINIVEHPDLKPFEGVDPNKLSCDPAGEIFLLLPHFTDCHKFFMCAHGVEVEFSCGAIYFDFERQTCNWPLSTKCWLRDEKEIDVEGSGDDDLGLYGEERENGPIDFRTAESSGTVRPVSAIAAQRFNGILNCQRADSASRQVAYKGDCQRYWKCVSGVPQIAYCSDGLFFNENSQQCDFEANSHCLVETTNELEEEFLIYK